MTPTREYSLQSAQCFFEPSVALRFTLIHAGLEQFVVDILELLVQLGLQFSEKGTFCQLYARVTIRKGTNVRYSCPFSFLVVELLSSLVEIRL